jgi:TrmH family RNA methyltransferase
MKIITSTQNSEIKNIVRLKSKKVRYQAQQFIAEGIRVCTTLLATHTYQLIQLYMTESIAQTDVFLGYEEQTALVSDAVMNKISNTLTPSGLVGIFQLPKNPDSALLSSGLVLAHLSNPGNMGTLMRSAAAMNIKTIVTIDGVDPYCPKVIQASAGTIGHLLIFQLSWQELLLYKKQLNLCALVPTGGSDAHELTLTNSLFIIGNEAHGIDPQWLNTCEQKMTIAMPGDTESLNAAVAGSIALYIASQQKKAQIQLLSPNTL